MNPNPQSPEFWDKKALDDETLRVFDICHQCRRCYNLCPSFNSLFQMIDAREGEGDVTKLTTAEKTRVVDECYECRLCYNHCPYTPPHHWQLDFPLLMLRSKAVAAREHGRSFRDRFLAETDRAGRMGTTFAPFVNWAGRNRASRVVMEKVVGIHRDRKLPEFAGETFYDWFSRRGSRGSGENGEVTLFHTCMVNYSYPHVGRAATAVLEHNGVRVHVPEQICCGMPSLDSGDLDAVREKVRINLKQLGGSDRPVVVPGPSCSLMLKQEYPRIAPSPETESLAGRTRDLCEFLVGLRRDGKLRTDFKNPAPSVLYQAPCHLRAQNIGFKSLELLRAIPGANVTLVEKCSAMDGSWGMKSENYQISLSAAKPLLREVEASAARVVASDCPLSGLQIEQGTGRKVVHPIEVLRDAYGLE